MCEFEKPCASERFYDPFGEPISSDIACTIVSSNDSIALRHHEAGFWFLTLVIVICRVVLAGALA